MSGSRKNRVCTAMPSRTATPSRTTARGRAAALTGLCRVKLSVFVALSAATGHAAGAGAVTAGIALPAAACMLLATGASALNQWQERERDALMSRTRRRPLPAGRVSQREALALAGVLLLAGLALLGLGGGVVAVALGVAAIVVYNGIYTPMKRWTAFAAVPGAVIGSLGPAIGWATTGASLLSPALGSIMLLFYLWQVPHFWLLSLRFPDDYTAAGLPCATRKLGTIRLARLVVVWTAAAVLVSLLLPLYGLLQSAALYGVLSVASVAFGLLVAGLLRVPAFSERDLRRSFAGINLFVLVAMIVLLVDSGF